MAAPTYTTDLTTIADFDDTSSGTLSEFTGYTLGGPPVYDADYYIQGSGCATTPEANKSGLIASIGIDYGTDLASGWTTGDCFFLWQVMLAGNAMDSLANGGMRVLIGESFDDFIAYYTGGNDFGRNPYGGWQNVVVDPTRTGDVTHGTGNATIYQTFGSGLNMVSNISKGNLHGLDVIRYGRGEIIIANGSSGVSANFGDVASANDSQANRWGLFQEVVGGYLWKGLMSFGSAATSVDFSDSNVNINIDDTRQVYADFNRIEMNNATSVISWDTIQIASVGTAAPGNFEMIDNCYWSATGCTFTDMGTFILQSNASTINCIWRRTDEVTQGGAYINGCTFDQLRSSVALTVSDLCAVQSNTFISDGTGHAIELTSAHAGGSYTWTNQCTAYATADGSTGNEVLYNNSGGAVTIVVCAGCTPSVRNGAAASTTIIAGAISVTVNTLTPEGSAVENARVFLPITESSTGLPFETVVNSVTNTGTCAVVTHSAHNLLTNDYIEIQGADLQANNGVHQITKLTDDSYYYIMQSAQVSNPTGTITCTFVALYGLTSATGGVTTSRVYPSGSTGVGGWARKSTSSPYYKTSSIVGSIANTADFSATAVMISDE